MPCQAGDAFTAFVSGAGYIPGILCLQRALWRVHQPDPPCPLIVIVDDRPAHELDTDAHARLERGLVPPSRVVRLTTLFRRLNGTRRALYGLRSGSIPAFARPAEIMCGANESVITSPISAATCSGWTLDAALARDRALVANDTAAAAAAAARAGGQSAAGGVGAGAGTVTGTVTGTGARTRTTTAKAKRDLKRPDGQEYLRSWLKVWLWALPEVQRAVHLDGDMLVQRPLDALFSRTHWPIRFGTIAAVRASSCPGQYSFNSGLFVYHPSLHTARSLIGRAHDIYLNMKISRYRPFKACELSVGDQTLLNLQFAPRTRYVWTPLPPEYNTPTHGQQNATFLSEARVLHFAGDLKPWLSSLRARTSAGGRLWMQSVCGKLVSAPDVAQAE
jgi:hypothetical protein